MGGKASRSKGIRAELQLRDELRKRGYSANRIPLSGSMEGFKGDVTFSKDGQVFTAEVKCRAKGFERLYEILKELPYAGVLTEGKTFTISRTVEDPLAGPSGTIAVFTGKGALFEQMEKWIQDCDVLVIKQDRKPFLYIRYERAKHED